MLKKVYICSPLSGNIRDNLQAVRRYAEYALRSGTAPVVPHLYALCLDDNDPAEREIGMKAGQSLLWFCDEMWVFGDTVSEGMQREIDFCKNMNIRICYVKDSDIRKKLEGGKKT